MRLSTADYKPDMGSPFALRTYERPIVVDSTAYDPQSYTGTARLADYIIPAGTPMSPVTASDGRYIPVKRSAYVSKANASSDTQITVTDASPFRVGDVIVYLDSSANYVPVAIGTILTITGEAINIDGTVAAGIGAGDLVQVAYNRRDVVLLGETVRLWDDIAGAAVSVPAVGVIGGQISEAKLNWAHNADWQLLKDMPKMDFLPVEPGALAAPDQLWRQRMSLTITGNVAATVASRIIGIVHGAGTIVRAGFSLGETGADGTDALSFEGDILINGTTVFSTKPVIAKAATDGASTYAAATGVTPGVLNAAAVAVVDGDVITFVATATRTTPETEAANLLAECEIAMAVGA